jgi:signal peptidase I
MNGERRGIAARLGLSALNLPLPGLGLLRIGEGRRGAICIAINSALLPIALGCFAFAPTLGFAGWLALSLSLLLVWLVLIVGSATMTWRRSAELRSPERWWSRWYGMAGILAVSLALVLLLPSPRNYYRNFYVPSEAMAPTLTRNDRFVARMSDFGELRRGDVVLVRTGGGAIYVERIAALGGDRIAMTAGVVVLNGRAVPQRLLRTERADVSGPGFEVRRLAERFPGERRDHEIYDAGPSPMDDLPETVVRPGHVYLLGDNRDNSADSRAPRAMQGLEQVPVGDVIGRPLFFSWWGGTGRAGQPIAD